jgi:hypothetical protein
LRPFLSEHLLTRPQATKIKAPFLEQFTDDWSDRWTPSEATKKSSSGSETFSYNGKWSVEESSVYPAIAGDKGLVAKSRAAHHAISAPFKKAIDFKTKPLVVQYEVKYQDGGNCGGGYLKLLRDGFQNSGTEFDDKTPWVVMFGPDLTCPGTKVMFLFYYFPLLNKLSSRCTLSSSTRTPLLASMKRSTTAQLRLPLLGKPRSFIPSKSSVSLLISW